MQKYKAGDRIRLLSNESSVFDPALVAGAVVTVEDELAGDSTLVRADGSDDAWYVTTDSTELVEYYELPAPKAVVEERSFTREVVTTETVTKREVVLRLTEDEAAVLKAITEHIGGDPWNSPRGLTNEIGQALSAAGIQGEFGELIGKSGNRAIYFEDYQEAA